jgi:hypothetical protein
MVLLMASLILLFFLDTVLLRIASIKRTK